MKAVCLGVLAAFLFAGAAQAKARPDEPAWVRAATQQMIKSNAATYGANPVLVSYLSYPRKIAVVIEYDRIVYCGCGGPTARATPGGRVVRVSFDRASHQFNSEFRFCEVRGASPPLAACLAR